MRARRIGFQVPSRCATGWLVCEEELEELEVWPVVELVAELAKEVVVVVVAELDVAGEPTVLSALLGESVERLGVTWEVGAGAGAVEFRRSADGLT